MANLKNFHIKDIVAGFKKNLTWLFVVVLLIVLIMEGFEVRNSLNILLSVQTPVQAPPVKRGNRVDFIGYNQVIEHIQDAKTYNATPTPSADPF